jgi:ABC-type dipeptide/oligopeptide/nickel transport system ATPase component
MSRRIVFIFGAGGSGKSFTARKIAVESSKDWQSVLFENFVRSYRRILCQPDQLGTLVIEAVTVNAFMTHAQLFSHLIKDDKLFLATSGDELNLINLPNMIFVFQEPAPRYFTADEVNGFSRIEVIQL